MSYRTRESLSPAVHRHSSSLRSPLRDLKDQNDLRKRSAISPSPERSPAVSESPLHAPRKRRTSEDRRYLHQFLYYLLRLYCLILPHFVDMCFYIVG